MVSVLIPKNSEIPCEETKTYFNDSSNTEDIEILIYQGDHQDGSNGKNIPVKDCVKVADMVLSGFKASRAG